MNANTKPRQQPGRGAKNPQDKWMIPLPGSPVNPLVHIIFTGRDLLATRQWIADYERGAHHEN